MCCDRCHSHLRQVIRFIELKASQALHVTQSEPLARLLNNGQVRVPDCGDV